MNNLIMQLGAVVNAAIQAATDAAVRNPNQSTTVSSVTASVAAAPPHFQEELGRPSTDNGRRLASSSTTVAVSQEERSEEMATIPKTSTSECFMGGKQVTITTTTTSTGQTQVQVHAMADGRLNKSTFSSQVPQSPTPIQIASPSGGESQARLSPILPASSQSGPLVNGEGKSIILN